MDPRALVASTAANLAGWHDVMLVGLGHAARYADGLWLTSDHVPQIFFSAIAVRHDASVGALSEGTARDTWIAVCDPWRDMHLDPTGFSVEADHAWMVRAPSPAPEACSPPELEVERVIDPESLAEFELASALGFGSPPQPAFTWHAPSVLKDPRLTLWRGRRGDRTVSTSMSFAHAGVVGIYGVSTVPDERRRGYARALTVAALTADPSLPSVLQPSATAEPLYRALGYERFTTFRTWLRAATPELERSTR
jgi:hypothetical protein